MRCIEILNVSYFVNDKINMYNQGQHAIVFMEVLSMNEALKTQLKILKLSDIKPNFSELARFYDLDRRTVKKYYDGYEGKAAHRDKPSKLDKHYDLIKQKLSIRGANVRAVYEFILSERIQISVSLLIDNNIRCIKIDGIDIERAI